MGNKSKTSPPLPFEQTTTVADTPDLQAFRAFQPNTTLLDPAIEASFGRARQDVTDNYGAYTGIPSQVARNRLRDQALGDLEGARATAMASGNRDAQSLRMAQLESLSQLTRGQTTRGFNTQFAAGQSNGMAAAGIGAGGAVTAAIIAS